MTQKNPLFRHSEVAISTAEQVAGHLASPHEELPEAMLVLEALTSKVCKAQADGSLLACVQQIVKNNQLLSK
jgi:hypothetical protein